MNSSWISLVAMAAVLLAAGVRADELVGPAASRPYRPPPLRPGDVLRALEEQPGPAVVLQRPVAIGAPPLRGSSYSAEPSQPAVWARPGGAAFAIGQVAPGTVLATTGTHSAEFTGRVRAQSPEGEAGPLHRELPPTSDCSNQMFHWQPAYRDPGPENATPVVWGESEFVAEVAPRRAQVQPGPGTGTFVPATRPAEIRPIARSVSTLPTTLPAPVAIAASGTSETGLTAAPPPPNSFRRVPTFPSDQGGVVYASVAQPEEKAQAPACVSDVDRFYGQAEYLLWWAKGSPLPPPATTVPVIALSNPGSVVVLGDDKVGRDASSGGRFQLGYWVLDEHLLGVEVGGFFRGQQSDRVSLTSLSNELLTRPVQSTLWGAELDFRASMLDEAGCNVDLFGGYHTESNQCFLQCQLTMGYNVDLLAGYRTVGLNESLTITSVKAGTSDTMGAIPTFYLDRFRVNNQFQGGQVGAEARLLLGQWSLEAKARLALGYTMQSLDISGLSSNGSAGILATASNSGHYQREVFSAVPEVGLTAGYQVTDWMRASIGYDLLYWNSVLRPGNQIDRMINEVSRSSPAFNATDFWAQGINLGLEFRY